MAVSIRLDWVGRVGTSLTLEIGRDRDSKDLVLLAGSKLPHVPTEILNPNGQVAGGVGCGQPQTNFCRLEFNNSGNK